MEPSTSDISQMESEVNQRDSGQSCLEEALKVNNGLPSVRVLEECDLSFHEKMDGYNQEAQTSSCLNDSSVFITFEDPSNSSVAESMTLCVDSVAVDENKVIADTILGKKIEPESCSSQLFEASVIEEESDSGNFSVLTFTNESSDVLHENPVVFSDFVVPSTNDESRLKTDTKANVNAINIIGDDLPQNVILESIVSDDSKDDSRLDVISEDEGVNFDATSARSWAESSSSKSVSPSGPSCSGTSIAGVNSLSSDSEDEVPSVDLTLPFKKRKMENLVEILSSSSEDESPSEIDYAKLTPDEIRALIEKAKRYGNRKRRCKCPKKNPSEFLPAGKSATGKPESCVESACSGGSCRETSSKQSRSERRRGTPSRSLLKSKVTNEQDVPIVELSDTEETSPLTNTVASEVTISAVPSGECIVLSSSDDDDDDVVCELVIKTEGKPPSIGGEGIKMEEFPKERSPDVVVLNASTLSSGNLPAPYLPSTMFPPLPGLTPLIHPTPIPQVPDNDSWPDINLELENWNETMNLLADICNPQTADGGAANSSGVTSSASVPARPSTPEGWCCPICLESKTAVNEIMSTTCGHVFCGTCIRSAVKIHKKCPTCRKKLTMKQFHKIFL